MSAATELTALSAVELHGLYRDRSLSPVEVVEAVLERIAERNDEPNAVVTHTPELALEAARRAEADLAAGTGLDRPLLGIPLTVKDNIPTAGIRTTFGSLLHADNVPAADAPVVERARAAGAAILGKTNTPEFGWKGATSNRVFGPTRNPWRLDSTPGGSSGGAAAAVASGFGPLAIGTDGAGSIRIPAAFCGLFGLKASCGLVPVAPASPIGTLSHHCPLSRTVADAALFLDAVAGPDARDPVSFESGVASYLDVLDGSLEGLRVGWSPDLGHVAVEPEVARLTAAAVPVFEELGATVVEIEPPFEDPHRIVMAIFESAQAVMHRHDLETAREKIDPGRYRLVEAGLRLSAADAVQAQLDRAALAERVRQLFERVDLLLTPTLPLTSFPPDADGPESVAGVPTPQLTWTPFTYPFNLSGNPAASVPCGIAADSLPVGLQIVGGWRRDDLVLSAAAAFEEARPWPRLAVRQT